MVDIIQEEHYEKRKNVSQLLGGRRFAVIGGQLL